MACGNYKEYCESEFYRPEYMEPPLSSEEKKERETAKILTRYAWISVLLFLSCVAGGTLLRWMNEKYLESSAKNEAFAYEADTKEHRPGEEFPIQDLILAVGEARTLIGPGISRPELEEGWNLPGGKKLVVVKITERSGDPEAELSSLSELYIQWGDAYYCQADSWDAGDLEMLALEEYFFEDRESGKPERWAAFVVDEEAQRFVLCLEERSGRYLERIRTIHQVPVSLQEGD